MSPSPSPFSHSLAHLDTSSHPPRPLPSPSLSPSITSLLNNSTTDSLNPTPAFYEPQDYFGQPPPDPRDVFGANSRVSPTPSNKHKQSFQNLLTPDPAHTPPPPPPPPPPPGPTPSTRPKSGTKRPRPTSSSSFSSSSHDGLPAPLSGSSNGTNGGGGAGGAGEQEGDMQPPLSRLRRSSSTSSASTPAPPPPPPSAPTSATASSVPSKAAPPPPPPPAMPPRRPSDLPLEPSVFNVEPIDEFTREVADWLWGFCAPLDWSAVEIEAKIGILVDTRAGGSRVHLPVPIETILTDDSGLRFQSNMTVNQHKSFNRLLNSRVEETAQPSYPHAVVRYAHTREADTFHEVSIPGQPRRKVRVTRDQKDRNKAKAVEKVRVADMNIYSPKRAFDWRVSVSLENPAPVPDTPTTHTRYKDRISYTHQLFTVDLTQVSPNPPSASSSAPAASTTHELEIEFRNARTLLEEAAKEQRGEEGRYLEMVQGLLNNVRMLIRNASDP